MRAKLSVEQKEREAAEELMKELREDAEAKAADVELTLTLTRRCSTKRRYRCLPTKRRSPRSSSAARSVTPSSPTSCTGTCCSS